MKWAREQARNYPNKTRIFTEQSLLFPLLSKQCFNRREGRPLVFSWKMSNYISNSSLELVCLRFSMKMLRRMQNVDWQIINQWNTFIWNLRKQCYFSGLFGNLSIVRDGLEIGLNYFLSEMWLKTSVPFIWKVSISEKAAYASQLYTC